MMSKKVIDINPVSGPDSKIPICTGEEVQKKAVANRTMTWGDFLKKIGQTTRTEETFSEYQKMSKKEKNTIKDVGFFIGGPSKNKQRKANSIESRCIITLDVDQVPVDWQKQLPKKLPSMAWAAYTSHSHAPEKPRLRIIIPLARHINIYEHAFLIRFLGDMVGKEWFDDDVSGIFRPNQPMFWPSSSKDGEFVFLEGKEKKWLKPDEILEAHKDWEDVSTWPFADAEQQTGRAHAEKAEDPHAKRGVIGAFCRMYTVDEAIARFLPETYIKGTVAGRYTYAKGSTTNGAVVYDDGKFLYSHHSTDPCQGLVNAFDMVRKQLFLHKDKKANEDAPMMNRPSYKACVNFLMKDTATKSEVFNAKFREASEDFKNGVIEKEDYDWRREIVTSEGGNPKPVLSNAYLFLENDPEFQGCAIKNNFSGELIQVKSLGGTKEADKEWEDVNTTYIRWKCERVYGVSFSKDLMHDALGLSADSRAFHPVKDWFNTLPTWDGVPRVEGLFVDYLGTDDNLYTRAIARKILLAAYNRIYDPGCKFDFVPIIEGPQGAGKSTFWKIIANDWFTELDTFDSKEAGEIIQGCWFLELGELSAFNKFDTEKIKSFISKTHDKYRGAYARNVKSRPRQCVFVGSTNKYEYLKDETGNRRFWPIKCNRSLHRPINLKKLKANVLQIWSELESMAPLGEELYIDDKEVNILAQMEQKGKIISDEWEGVIEQYLNDGFIKDITCVPELWEHCFEGVPAGMSRKESIRIGACLRNLGWENVGPRKEFNEKYGSQRCFRRPGLSEDL